MDQLKTAIDASPSSRVKTDASEPTSRRRSWDDFIAEAEINYVERDYSVVNHGPLSMVGMTLPTDRLDFCWGRHVKADGDDDVRNVRELEAAGWRVAPADLLTGSQFQESRERTIDGGISVGSVTLMCRTKRATAAAEKARQMRADAPLQNVLSIYEAKTNVEGLTSRAPEVAQKVSSKVLRGRQAMAELDDT